MPKWISKTVTIGLPTGLHARTSMMLIEMAKDYNGGLTIEKNEHKVDASSILAILSLGAETGQTVTLHIEEEGAELLETLSIWLESPDENPYSKR